MTVPRDRHHARMARIDSDDEFDVDDPTFEQIAEESLAQIEQDYLRRTTQSRQSHPQARRNVGTDDFRITHKGRLLPGQNLPRPDVEEDDDAVEAQWRRMDLDSLEQEAIAASQSPSSSLKRGDVIAAATGKRPRGHDDMAQQYALPASKPKLNGNFSAERQEDSERVKQLLKQLEEKDEELKRVKRDWQAKSGEVTLVRARLNNIFIEHSSLYKEKEEDLARQRALVRELQQTVESKDSELKTVQTFRGFEANTSSTHLWSHVSASVARRRGQHSVQRDYSQSHSQTAAAAAGLITPTRRNRGQGNRALNSPSSGGARNTMHERSGDESPSNRRSKHPQVAATPFRDTRPDDVLKKSAFPGFVNSFAQPAIRTPRDNSVRTNGAIIAEESQSRRKESPAIQHDFDDTALDIPHLEGKAPETEASFRSPQEHFNWAVSTYTRQQTFLLSLIISHESTPCPVADVGQTIVAPPEPLTLQRLMRSPISAEDDAFLYKEYMAAVQFLFHSLTRGSALDAEDRFAFLQDADRSYNELEDANVLAQDCIELMEVGVNEVLSDVATSLRVMMAIALHVGSADRLYDVLVLLRSISVHYASMLRLLIFAPCAGLTDPMDEAFGEDISRHCETQKHLKFAFDQVAVACITHGYNASTTIPQMISVSKPRRLARSRMRSLADSNEDTSAHADTEVAMLQAVLGIIEILALEIQHNDTISLACLQTMRSIFGKPDILASLLTMFQHTSVIRRTLGIMTLLLRHDTFWHTLLACPLQDLRGVFKLPSVAKTHFAGHSTKEAEGTLFALLAKVLVDGPHCVSDAEMHAIHHQLLIFVQQLIICHPDVALPLVASSGALTAGLVRCLYADTDLIWNEASISGFRDDANKDNVEKYIRATLRIEKNVQFLANVYILAFDQHRDGRPMCDSLGPILAQQLSNVSNEVMLNGFRHCFLVAMSRIAFASEPEWMLDEERSSEERLDAEIGMEQQYPSETLEAARASLGAISEAAADLLELVFTPDEIESCWKALIEEESDEEDEDEVAAANAAEADVHMSQGRNKTRSSQPSAALGKQRQREQSRHEDAAIVVSDTDD